MTIFRILIFLSLMLASKFLYGQKLVPYNVQTCHYFSETTGSFIEINRSRTISTHYILPQMVEIYKKIDYPIIDIITGNVILFRIDEDEDEIEIIRKAVSELRSIYQGSRYEKGNPIQQLLAIRDNALAGDSEAKTIFDKIIYLNYIRALDLSQYILLEYEPDSQKIIMKETSDSEGTLLISQQNSYYSIDPLGAILLDGFIRERTQGNASLLTLSKDTNTRKLLKRQYDKRVLNIKNLRTESRVLLH